MYEEHLKKSNTTTPNITYESPSKKFRRSEDEIGIEKRPGETRNGDRSQSSGGEESQRGQRA